MPDTATAMATPPEFQLQVVQVLPGPSLAAWHDCLRVVLTHKHAPLHTTPEMLWERLKGYPHNHLTPRPLVIEFGLTEPGHVFAAFAMALLRAARHVASKHRIAPLSKSATEITLEIMTPESAKALAQMALALTRVAFNADEAAPWGDPLWMTLCDLLPRTSHYHAQDRLLAARQMGLHCEVGGGLHRAHYRVGQGPKSQLMANAYSAQTSHLGKDLAGDKIRARTALARAGLPVPAQQRVTSSAEAVQAAIKLGLPVVLKPSGSRASQGVFTMLRTVTIVEDVYQTLAGLYPEIIVEKQVIGEDYRLLVIGGRCVAAAQRLHPCVAGDGVSTVAELVEASNRSHGRDGIFIAPIAFDTEILQTLSDQNLGPDSTPPAGTVVVLRRAACPSSLARDVSGDIHPSVKHLAEKAAAAVQLDFAGVDLVSADITRPWTEVETAIVEINAGPGLDINRFPDLGAPRPVARHILRSAVPAGQPSNIPLVCVVGRYGKQLCADMLTSMLRMSGVEARVADNLRDPFPASLPSHHGAVRAWVGGWLSRTEIDALVLPLPWSALAREGMPAQQHSVAILVDEEGDFRALEKELMLPGIQAKLYRMVCDTANNGVVFDATSLALRAATAHMPPHATVACLPAPTLYTESDWLKHHRLRGGEAILTVTDAAGAASFYLAPATGDWQPLLTLPPPAQSSNSPNSKPQAIAHALAAMRLLGCDLASLQSLALLCAQQADPATLPKIAPWTLKVPTSAPEVGSHLLRQLVPTPTTYLQVFCQDSEPMRNMLAQWSALLAPYRHAWCIQPSEEASSGNISTRDQLVAQGWDPALVQRAPNPPDNAPSGTKTPQLHITDHLHGPLLQGLCKTSSEEACVADEAWTADTLAVVAGATWIGKGYPRHWDASRIAIESESPEGKLVIVEGVANSLAAIQHIEHRTREAFSQGAQAVMSAVMPPELPRWMPFLLSDDPTHSLYQLAKSARARCNRPVTILLGGGSSPSPAIAALVHQSQMALDRIFQTPSAAEYAHRTALALARLSTIGGDAPGGILLPSMWRIDEITLAQPNHCVVLADDFRTLDRLAVALHLLRSSSITIVGLSPSQHDACKDLVNSSHPEPQRLRFAPTMENMLRTSVPT